MRVVTMSNNIITRTLTEARQKIDYAEYSQGRKPGSGRRNYKIDRGSSYITSVLKRSRPFQGMVCRRCGDFIKPLEKCYSKQGNNDHSIRTYYHIYCCEKLYH